MINKPFLSIIVPIYGVEEYLFQCVDSILKQTFKDFEIILVNDGSKDGCGKICDEFSLKDSRVRVIHKENGGLVSARKAGLLISKGTYIGYVDGDDWIEPQMFEELINCAIQNDAEIVISGHKEELNGIVTEILYNNLEEGLYKNEKLHNDLYCKMINTGSFSQFGIFTYLWNKIFKRDLIFQIQMDVNDKIFMAEDAACTYPAILKANSVYIKHTAKYRYRQRFNSMVKTRDINYLELEKYNLLYLHLINIINISGFNNLLIPQLDTFLLSLLTVRCDLKHQLNLPENELFPFGNVLKGSKLIILGAGTFGQHLVNRLLKQKEHKVICWVDNVYKDNNLFGIKIKNTDEIVKLDFDLILIAHIDETVSIQREQDLLKTGIKVNKIRKPWIFNKINTKDILLKVGISA